MSAATFLECGYPRSVTPGIESHPEHPVMPVHGVYVGLDWFRFTGPEDVHRVEVEGLLQEVARTKPERSKGAAYFSEGQVWKPGLLMSWGHRSRICQVDIQGGRLRLMPGDHRIDLFRSLVDLGMKPTRIDACIDFVGQGHELYANARASCERDELCKLRSYGDNSRRTVGQRPDRLHLNLGRRDSPVCGRIYDKGLEAKVTETAGRWERLEIEWKGDRVQEVARRVYDSGKAWSAMLTSLVFGAVDFREVSGQTKLNRRPRCEWWERVLARHAEVATSPASKSPDLERWCSSFQTSYGRRLLEMAASVKRPVGEVVSWLLHGLQPSDSGGELVREFVRVYRTPAAE